MDDPRYKDSLINFKVYIAGQYAPAISVVAQSGVFSFSEARVSLFPHKELVELGENDRVPIQIFYLDTHYDSKDLEYRLIFDGEIVKTDYVRTPNSISLDVSCVSNFEILTQMFLILFTNILDQYTRDKISITPTDQTFGLPQLTGEGLLKNFSDYPLTDTTVFDTFFSKEYLKEAAVGAQGDKYITRPFTVLRNILINLINGFDLVKKSSDDKVHLFLKNFISKRQLIESMFASPKLENKDAKNVILNAVKGQSGYNAITKGVSSMLKELGSSSQVSYWQVITAVYSKFMYELLLPICPPYLKADIYGVPVESTATNFSYEGIANLISKPSIQFGVPPLCNTIFPSMINQIGISNNILTKPSRFYLGNISVLNDIGVEISPSSDPISAILYKNNSVVWPPELANKSVSNVRSLNDVTNDLLWNTDKGKPNEFFRGPVVKTQQQAPDWIGWVKDIIVSPIENQTEEQSNFNDATQERLKAVNIFLSKLANVEFEREKSSQEVITIDMKFDPYLIAGFPAAILDGVNFGNCFYALPVQVTHTLTQSSAHTSVQLINAIPFKKALFHFLINFPDNSYTMGPIHPDSNVADVFNSISGASNYYSKVLYQGSSKKNFCFKPDRYFIMENYKGKKVDETKTSTDIYTKGVDIHSVRDNNSREVITSIKNDRLILFRDYNEALKHIARPIATLPQFVNLRKKIRYMNSSGVSSSISSYGGTVSLGQCIRFDGGNIDAVTRSKSEVKSTEEFLTKVGAYYTRILEYSDMTQTDSKGNLIFKNAPTDVDNYPDFVDNWAGKIEKYRNDILSNKDILIY